MKRLSPLLLAILVCAGCHAPMPSFNLLAPYGSTRIPPPATGSMAPDTYYQPSQQSSSTAPVGTGFRARQSSTSLSAAASSKSSGIKPVSDSTESGQVTPATHETTTTVVDSRDVIRVVESGTTPSALPPKVRGMRINETTVEPRRFSPSAKVIDIMQLPPTSSLRYANVVPVNQAVGSSAARASTSSTNSSRSATAGGTGWRARN